MDKLEPTVVDKLPRYIQVNSTLEFTRLVCALERAPRVSFSQMHTPHLASLGAQEIPMAEFENYLEQNLSYGVDSLWDLVVQS